MKACCLIFNPDALGRTISTNSSQLANANAPISVFGFVIVNFVICVPVNAPLPIVVYSSEITTSPVQLAGAAKIIVLPSLLNNKVLSELFL